jgi:DNA replication licensing factor MCM4
MLTETASNQLINEYLAMRNMGNAKKTITATPRQLESMIRIAEAIAKMRLAAEVDTKDVSEAVNLIKQAMR